MATDREELVAQLTEALAGRPGDTGPVPRGRARRTRVLAGRERTKTNAIRMLHECRMTLRELGRRMVERGAFDEIEDFGMLRKAEYDDFLADPKRVHEHDPCSARAVPQSCQALEPPFVFVGEPDFPAAWTRRDAIQVEAARSRATRSPACPGAPVSPRAAPA